MTCYVNPTNQDSHATWKVLVFLKCPEPGSLENEFGSGKFMEIKV